MKLQRFPEYLISIVAILIGLVFALYAGKLLGSGNIRNLTLLTGVIAFIVIGLVFKQRIWILIFLCWPMTGRLFSMPASPHDISILLAFAWFLLFKAFKLVRNKPTYGLADLLVFINIIYIGIAYFRNPVGGLVMGTDSVGVRPYVDIALGAMTYWVIVRADVTTSLASRLPFLGLLSCIPNVLVNTLATFFPGAQTMLAHVYADIHEVSEQADFSAESGNARIGFLREIGLGTISILSCLYRPSTLINPIYLGRFILMVFGCVAILLAGFRSYFIMAGLLFVVYNLYRRKGGELFRIGLIMGPLLILFVAMQGVLYELPFPVQRTLSFLPGRWNEGAKESAESSSEWRFEMWRIMWKEEKYLHNWWLGDGFGYSRQTFMDNQMAAISGDYRAYQETFLITGGVHSGPLSTIRYFGYIGLFLYLLLACLVARVAHRFILRARGTPYFFPVLFFGAPCIIKPLFFVAVFGAYQVDMPATLFSLGMLRLLERSFNRYRSEQEAAQADTKEIPQLLDERPAMLTC